jgi:hypothetical protein
MGTATRLWDGQPGFDSQQGQEIIFFSMVPMPVRVPTQVSLQGVTGGHIPGEAGA